MQKLLAQFDWVLVGSLVPIAILGLLTMNSFGTTDGFMERQLIWFAVAIFVMVSFSSFDPRVFQRTNILVGLFLVGCVLLIALFIIADPIKGSRRWIDLGFFSLQPSDPVKIILILILAKYFSRRHIEIKNIKHILVPGVYALIPFALVFLQPDLGSAIVIFLIWIGMILVAGISLRHLALVFGVVVVGFTLMWFLALKPYQKERIMTFLSPLEDVRGAGYNAYQSTIAVGSGQLLGKGVGYGTQSRLQFLPEHQTDFIFAAFAEEWGFAGSLLLLAAYGVLIWRLLRGALRGASNFETLFSVGVAIFFLFHIVIHIGMNIGLLPVTGITLPFMSYGGSHLLTEAVAIGIFLGMMRYSRSSHPEDLQYEFVGFGS